MKAKTKDMVPVWSPCNCGDYVCQIHHTHVADCECPGIEFWAALGISPYSHLIERHQEK